MPASDPTTDPVDELIDLAAMTRDSLDAGYTGLRIVANGTLRMIDPRRRDRIVHFEHLIDRFCLDHAFTRLCASTSPPWARVCSASWGACTR
jgi:hypothetical protein